MSYEPPKYLVVGLTEDGDEIDRATVTGPDALDAMAQAMCRRCAWVELFRYSHDGSLVRLTEERNNESVR